MSLLAISDLSVAYGGAAAPSLAGVSFALGADGKAVTVRIDAFDESHLGILRRVGEDGG